MKKDKRFGFVMYPSEKEALKMLAEIEGGLSEAAILRRLIRKEAMLNNIWKPIVLAQRSRNNA